MKIITKEIQKKLDKAGYYGDKAIFKLFNPCGAQTWIVFGQDPEDKDILYAVCDLGMDCIEAGPISLSELMSVKLPFGLSIERDMYFSKEGEPIEHFLNLESLAGI